MRALAQTFLIPDTCGEWRNYAPGEKLNTPRWRLSALLRSSDSASPSALQELVSELPQPGFNGRSGASCRVCQGRTFELWPPWPPNIQC